jgi:hypothetical protein
MAQEDIIFAKDIEDSEDERKSKKAKKTKTKQEKNEEAVIAARSTGCVSALLLDTKLADSVQIGTLLGYEGHESHEGHEEKRQDMLLFQATPRSTRQ